MLRQRVLPRSTYLGVLLLAASVIVLQIALTRVLAIMMWHHLTYMVISVALLGFGASGSILTVRNARRSGEDSPSDSMATYCAAYGLSVLGAFAVLRMTSVDTISLWENKSNLLLLFVLYAAMAMPFLLGGMALGTALTRCVRQVNRLYFVDLVGSGIGAACSVPLLDTAGGSVTVVLAAVIALLGAFAFSLGAGRWTRAFTGVALAAGVVFSIILGGGGLGLPHWEWHPPFAAGKTFVEFEGDPDLVRVPSATAEVEVTGSRPLAMFLGGDVGRSALGPITGRSIGQDGTAPTLLLERAGELERYPNIAKTQAASAYVALESRGGTSPDVLVIGVGGGVDVMIALASGARSVTAVEVNTAMVRVVTDLYDDYLAGLFRPGAHDYSDRITLVNREGRSFLRGSTRKYDVIQMSGVDSYTALASGAYTLSESYLYTTEAVRDFYEHLTDDGYVNYSRMLLSQSRPRETLRLANIAYTALAELGIPNPGAHIVVFQGRQWASTMIKRSPFVPEEVAALERFAREEGFLGLLFDPLRPAGEPVAPAVAALDYSETVSGVLPDILAREMPAAVDRVEELRPQFVRGYEAIVANDREALEAVVAAVAAEFPDDDREQLAAAATRVLGVMYQATYGPIQEFAASGEIFRELLGGTDERRRALMADYPFDVSPCTDDAPFFFNYFKYSELFRILGGRSDLSGKGAEFPVGHMVLLASLVQIVALACLLILLPLRRLAREGLRASGTWRYFAYFAALGVGFMFVEIVLMQKMVVFLGHPTYSLSVVLASLLTFAGIGSMLAGRFGELSRRTLLLLAAAIALLLAGVTGFMNELIPQLLGLPLGWRIAAVVVAICPVGLVLGMPFPTGMRIVERQCPQLLPWAWAVNGFTSVFASVFCIVSSMALGFTAVLLIAAGIYCAGLLAMPCASGRSAA